jgi:hypothetical protein
VNESFKYNVYNYHIYAIFCCHGNPDRSVCSSREGQSIGFTLPGRALRNHQAAYDFICALFLLFAILALPVIWFIGK